MDFNLSLSFQNANKAVYGSNQLFFIMGWPVFDLNYAWKPLLLELFEKRVTYNIYFLQK